MDRDEHRRASRDQWERSAAGWGARRDFVQRAARPVSHWLVDAIRPEPGQTLLELAAGPGDTGFIAAERIGPNGTLICSDFAEPMLEVARARANELLLENVDFRLIDAEAIDLPNDSMDGVLCRWGYMLMADPGAALRETLRVLRPGGRVALAAWAEPARNRWVSAIAGELVERGLAPPPDPEAPGMFAFAPDGRIEGLLLAAGFAQLDVGHVDFAFVYRELDDWWETSLALGRPLADVVARTPDDQVRAAREAVERELVAYRRTDGSVEVPARALVAVATA